MTEWQPIETAPKDEGAWILVYGEYHINLVHWVDLGSFGQWQVLETAEYDNNHFLGKITHWMPLPEPPQ